MASVRLRGIMGANQWQAGPERPAANPADVLHMHGSVHMETRGGRRRRPTGMQAWPGCMGYLVHAHSGICHPLFCLQWSLQVIEQRILGG